MILNEVVTQLRRICRIYIFPPKETKVFFDPKNTKVISHKVSIITTGAEPKQVAVNLDRKLAYVSCMKSRILQEFSYKEDILTFIQEWKFPEQCVEVKFIDGLIYLTTTNFKYGNEQKSYLYIFDPLAGKVISYIDTQGEWSKVMTVDNVRKKVFVSNWHSNDISVIDISNLKNPQVIQKVLCDKAPRGLALQSKGPVIATSFYGRKVFTIDNINGEYKIITESKVFDPKGYGGNMRDILITQDGKTVWVSNLGRNMIHWYDSETLELGGSILIPRQPNSMCFIKKDGSIIGLSCRKDGVICFVNTETKEVVRISEKTGKLPTGLASISGGFIITNFEDNTMELHKIQ